MSLPFEYMDLVKYFTIAEVWQHPWRFLMLWGIWFAVMFVRYLQLSYTFYIKHHQPFLGQEVQIGRMRHVFTNDGLLDEIILSFKTKVAISFLFAVATPVVASEYCPMYLDPGKYTYFYIPLSFVLVAILHDVAQYWTHRWAHEWSWYFHKVHAVHHRFRHPTPFSSWAMHPFDGVVNTLYVVAVVFVIPLHPLVFVLYIHWASWVNATGHAVKQGGGSRWIPDALEKYLGNGEMHIMHHKIVQANYFFFLKFWDIKCRTTPEAVAEDAKESTSSDHAA